MNLMHSIYEFALWFYRVNTLQIRASCWLSLGINLIERRDDLYIDYLFVYTLLTMASILVMESVLRRTGTTKYNAMLVAKAVPAGWTVPTLLLRFVDQNGAETFFCLTDDAKKAFDSCEIWRIYDMEVAAKCVRRGDTSRKYGMKSIYEVPMKLSRPLVLSNIAWPLLIRYDIVEWAILNQLEPDYFLM